MTDEKSMMFMKIVGKATLVPDISGVGGCGGNVFFLFRRKERTKEKSIGLFSRRAYLVQAF